MSRVSRSRLLLVLVALILACLAVGCGSGKPAATRGAAQGPADRVVLISWDGAQRAHVQQSMAQGHLPNLARLVAEGGFAATDITDHPTETIAGHMEMLTGYPPAITGARGSVPAALLMPYRIKTFFGADQVTMAWIASKDWRLGADPGEPYYYLKPYFDLWAPDGYRGMAITGPLAVKFVTQAAPRTRKCFCFFHFLEPDIIGHAHSGISPAYEAALRGLDAWLGRIRQALEQASPGVSTAVVVATDHGFPDVGHWHHGRPDAWMATNWVPLTDGDQKDLSPTLLDMFGIDYHQFSPALPGHSLLAARRSGT